MEGGGWGGGDGSILWQATENKKHVFCLPVFLVHILLLKEMRQKTQTCVVIIPRVHIRVLYSMYSTACTRIFLSINEV